MRLGVSAFAWTAEFDTSCLKVLGGLRDRGIEAIEIPMFEPSVLPVREIRSSLQAEGLDCTVCAILPKDANPISDERSKRERGVAHLEKCIVTSGELGATLLGGPLYAPIGYIPNHRPTPDQWLWAVEAFQSLGDLLERTGITLAIEPVNRSETSFLRTATEAKRLAEAIDSPQIGITLDTFHANIEEASISRAIQLLAGHLKHVHMSENDRGPLGQGHVPFNEIVWALGEIRFGGLLMIEGFGYSPNWPSAPGWLWAPKEVTPEILVEESAKFLKGILDTP